MPALGPAVAVAAEDDPSIGVPESLMCSNYLLAETRS